MLIAVTRAVSPTLAECELTHLPRDPINVAEAMAQHASYEAALRSLGATVVRAPDEPNLPDAVFVEDTALVLDEVAVITRPGAPSRRPEIATLIVRCASATSVYFTWRHEASGLYVVMLAAATAERAGPGSPGSTTRRSWTRQRKSTNPLLQPAK